MSETSVNNAMYLGSQESILEHILNGASDSNNNSAEFQPKFDIAEVSLLISDPVQSAAIIEVSSEPSPAVSVNTEIDEPASPPSSIFKRASSKMRTTHEKVSDRYLYETVRLSNAMTGKKVGKYALLGAGVLLVGGAIAPEISHVAIAHAGGIVHDGHTTTAATHAHSALSGSVDDSHISSKELTSNAAHTTANTAHDTVKSGSDSDASHGIGNGTVNRQPITSSEVHKHVTDKAHQVTKHAVKAATKAEDVKPQTIGGTVDGKHITDKELHNPTHTPTQESAHHHKEAVKHVAKHAVKAVSKAKELQPQTIGGTVDGKHITSNELHRHISTTTRHIIPSISHAAKHHILSGHNLNAQHHHAAEAHKTATETGLGKDSESTKKKAKALKKLISKKVTVKAGQNPWSIAQKALHIKGNHLNHEQLSKIWHLDQRMMKLNHLNDQSAKVIKVGAKLLMPKIG